MIRIISQSIEDRLDFSELIQQCNIKLQFANFENWREKNMVFKNTNFGTEPKYPRSPSYETN